MDNVDQKTKKILQEAEKALQGTMCYSIEWRDEDVPLENKEGDAMGTVVQKWIDGAHSRPALMEHFKKKNKEEPEKLAEHKPPPRESVLVFADDAGFCMSILSHAPEGRISQKKILGSDTYNTLSQDEVKELLKKGWDMIIFGPGLDMPASNGIQDIVEHQNTVSRLYFYISHALSRNEKICKKLCVLTRGCFSDDPSLHNSVGVGLVTAGTLFGASNTARQELGTISLQFIETEYSLTEPFWKQDGCKPLLPRLASEIFRSATFGHNTVRITHEGRYVLRQLTSKQYEVADQSFQLPSSGIIAITGGNGALGLVMGEWLLDKAKEQSVGNFTIKFLSRSAKVSDQNMLAWKMIEKKAAKLHITVEHTICDFSKQQECDNFIEACSPNLHGIIHSAGVLQDGMLMGLTWEKFEPVWDSKNRAALYLHDALERYSNPNLDFFWMFSSTSVYGNVGQFNYSAANSYLDALCRHRRATGKPALAVQWGAWGEVGMAAKLAPGIREAMEAGPQVPFLTKDGLQGLEAGLKTGLPGFSVYKINPKAYFAATENCDSSGACHFRNFTSEIIPTPGAPNTDRIHLYTMFRLLRDGYHGGSTKKLIFDSYIKPAVEEEDELDSAWW